jgi:hypothetical protein
VHSKFRKAVAKKAVLLENGPFLLFLEGRVQKERGNNCP